MSHPVMILRFPVQSSLLASVGYCPFTCLLDLQLRNGSLYRYYGVPVHIYFSLLRADSKGRYFNRHIKPTFQYQRFNAVPESYRLDASMSG